MKSVQAYTSFAQWLEKNHSSVFKKLLADSKTIAQLGAIYRSSFVGRFGDVSVDYSSVLDSSPDLSSVADTTAFDTSTVLDSGIDTQGPLFTGTADTGPITTDMTSYLQNQANIDLGVAGETATATLSTPSVSIPDTIPPMPASAPSSSASAVGNFLTSGQGLLSLAKAVTTVAGGVVAANVIMGQAQRAAAGQAPANVSYAVAQNPQTGVVSTIPVINTSQGQVPLSSVSSITPNFLSSNLPWLMLGAAALLYLME